MEENTVLQVILHEGDGLEIRLGNENKVNPLMLIGILEQVKMKVLNDFQPVEDMPSAEITPTTPKYDA